MNTVKPMTLMPLALNLRTIRLTTAIGAALLVSGCASNFNGPYQAPALTIPAQYSQASVATSTDASGFAMPDMTWWTRFNDPELDRLVAAVLQRNNNLAAAAIRVRRAQLLAGLADNNLQPRFSGSVGTGASLPLEAGAVTTTAYRWAQLTKLICGTGWAVCAMWRVGKRWRLSKTAKAPC
jgi:outer membrane protein TolC